MVYAKSKNSRAAESVKTHMETGGDSGVQRSSEGRGPRFLNKTKLACQSEGWRRPGIASILPVRTGALGEVRQWLGLTRTGARRRKHI